MLGSAIDIHELKREQRASPEVRAAAISCQLSGSVRYSIGLITLVAGVLALAAGCAQPYAASGLRPQPQEQVHFRPTLNSTDQSRIVQAMEQLTLDHTARRLPQPSARPRWSDLPLAVAYACDDAEMAVTRTIQHDWGYEFRLLTVDGFSGTLNVRRTSGDDVFNADAVIGIFGDRTEQAQRLVNALANRMKAFARKRGFEN
jgi:hypothetical protein